MKTVILGPEELLHGAVVPQCLDIHYLSDQTLKAIIKENKDYSDPEIAKLRQAEAHQEYRRSLIYARQTIVNRAYFFNPLVYDDFEDRKDNESNRSSFSQLIQNSTVIPFVTRGPDILADAAEAKLQISGRARRAVESLQEIIETLRCVGLDKGDSENKLQNAKLEQFFRSYCRSIGELCHDSLLLNMFAAEIYGGKSEVDLLGFGKALKQIAKFDEETFNRTVLYHKFLCKPDTPHHEGRFKSLAENPFLIEQKKVLDLSYNSNLPDLLGRYLMTPLGLPPQSAIDLVIPHPSFAGNKATSDLFQELQRKAAHTFMNNMQQTFYLPALSTLTIEDVHKIRSLDEWEPFAQMQEKMLADPIHCLDHLEAYATKLSDFQRAFSKWYYQTYKNAQRIKQYGSYVGITLKVAGKIFAAAATGLTPLVKIISAAGPEVIPERVKLLVARLIVAAVDTTTGIADPSLSYSLDLLKENVELTREGITALLEGFKPASVLTSNAGASNPST